VTRSRQVKKNPKQIIAKKTGNEQKKFTRAHGGGWGHRKFVSIGKKDCRGGGKRRGGGEAGGALGHRFGKRGPRPIQRKKVGKQGARRHGARGREQKKSSEQMGKMIGKKKIGQTKSKSGD